MSEVIILDVGHGNCAILRDDTQVAVIDAPVGSMLIDTLDDMGVDRVRAAFISHTDKDHIAGILALLTSDKIHLEEVFINPDSQKRSKIWADFKVAVSVAERKGECRVTTSLSTTTPGRVSIGESEIVVVSPSASLALTGVGGQTADKRIVTSNSLSAALKINSQGRAGILLAGDIDDISLEDALRSGADLSANTLVFPHHGGLPGTGPITEFTQKLIGSVKPKNVVFSNGRGRHDNPRPEVVDSIVKCGCAIACTQLSERCRATSADQPNHLENIRSHGKSKGSSCAGSMTFSLEKGGERSDIAKQSHGAFISESVPHPMCQPSGENLI
ncbi:hypothetical protein EYD00_13945 [Agrobacterium sp. 33MFTa1.1]|uniref:ComEC/Rec2 family competence protein n=1 Tax=Agrobacterium sp. 33MFTa1.1 TaxID=1279031 RepID=UPI0006910143|nr:hypothetical protein [Agrobacterium sp. 33MFTa1.1]QBJ14619.1 hypothetical protein EYD00_13945 [Agrobacterium sp. 33MFTa1.1]